MTPLSPVTLGTSPIVSSVNYDADGLQHGFLRLPHSRDDSAWGSVMVPISVMKRGDGPTVLLTGGSHGDEYEGPIALFDLARTIGEANVSGRVIIVPAMNHPAFAAGRRTSPIDGGNMNRIFPGRPDGTVTEKLADYLHRHLAPLADVVLDFHSGGKTLDFLPFAAAHILPDKVQERKCMAAVAAFSAPWSMRMTEIDAAGMFDTACEDMGKVFVTTELGGGGTATARTVAIARRGIRNLLIHAGVLDGESEPAETRWLEMEAPGTFAFAEEDGLCEARVDLGGRVRNGEEVARVYPIGRTGASPVAYHAGRDGILVGRHFPGLVKCGDCLAVIGGTEEDNG